MDASRWVARERELLERELREAGLERLAARLAGTAAPAIRLLAEDPEQRVPGPRRSHAPPSLAGKLERSRRFFGRTRLGGVPDVSAGFEWPVRQRSRKKYGARSEAGDPLSFVAQVNLSEMPRVVVEAGVALPPSGMLCFFYDAVNLSSGDPDDANGFRVVYEDVSVENLSPAAAPERLGEEWIFDVAPMILAPEMALPSGETEALNSLGFWSRGFPEEESEAYHELVERRNARAAGLATNDGAFLLQAPVHRLLGFPNVIQGEMELECQLASRGIDGECYWAPFRADGSPPPDVEDVAKDAAAWRLLLQLDSDPGTGMMWGDAGMLYYWIEEDALNKREFHRAWIIMQCY